MASTNKTPNFDLPQFLGTDKASWLGDVNPAMTKIDTQMKLNETNANQAIATASSAVNVANGASGVANAVNTEFNENIAYTVTAINTYVKSANLYSNKLLKYLFNLYGWVGLNNQNGTIPARAELFNTDIHPATERLLYGIMNVRYVTPTGFFSRTASLRLLPNGKLILDQALPVDPASTSFDGNIQCILNCRDWGI